jgi:Ribbon-helix-helix protein, copG family
VRTTLTLEDDVAARLQAEARRTGKSFKALVNEHLRRSLAQRTRAKQIGPFRVLARDLGGPLPGRSYDDVAALLDETEGPERR